MKKLLIIAITLMCFESTRLVAGPVDDFLKTVKGTNTEKEVQLQNRKVTCSFYKLDDEIDLTKTKELPKDPQSSPLELIRALAVLLPDLSAENIKTIKGYHTPDDVIQRIPADGFVTIMQKDRKDWVISTIVREGDFIFLCGQFKDGKTGKIEKDVYPMVFLNGSWHAVVANAQFINHGEMQLMEYLTRN